MPIYEYQCEQCGVRFERMQAMSAAPVTDCPECGGQVHRVISPVGVIFKGSGFYVTDNRKSSSGRTRKSDTTAAKVDSKTESESSAKTEPDTKSKSQSVSKKSKTED